MLKIMKICVIFMGLALVLNLTTTARAETFESLSGNFDELYRAGRYRAALVAAQKALKTARATYGANDARVGTAFEKLALLSNARGKRDEAQKFYKRSLAIYEKAYGPEDIRVANALVNMSRFYVRYDMKEDAEYCYIRAIEIYRKRSSKYESGYKESLEGLGDLYYMQGKFNNAEKIYTEAFDRADGFSGKLSPDVTYIIERLVSINYMHSNYAQAEKLCKHWIAIAMDEHKNEAETYVAPPMDMLGDVYFAKGQYDKALRQYQEVLEKRQLSMGKEHYLSIRMMKKIAATYDKMNKTDKAQKIRGEIEKLQKLGGSA